MPEYVSWTRMEDGKQEDWDLLFELEHHVNAGLVGRVPDHLKLLDVDWGGDRNARDRFKDHPHYQACLDFCHRYDQNAFDPDYDTLPLEHFEPAIRRVFARKQDSHPGLT